MAETVHSTEPERGVRLGKSLTRGWAQRAGGRKSHIGRCPGVAQTLPKGRGQAEAERDVSVHGGGGWGVALRQVSIAYTAL